MDQNFLFRWIWRFNAIALAVVLSLLGVSFLPYFYYMSRLGPVIETIEKDNARDQATPATGLRLFLDYTREGRREMVFALAPEQKVPVAYPDSTRIDYRSKANLSRVANYLFIDPATGSTRWLFPTNGQVITATDYVTKSMLNPAPGSVADSEVPVAVVYDVSTVQSPGASTKYQVYASRLDGTNLTKLFDDLDEVATFVPSADNTIFATYKTKGRHMASTVSVADFKVVMTKDLQEFEPK